MKKQIIIAPKGSKYLSDVFNMHSEHGPLLPRNCIIDKKVTGCGATYSAIVSPEPTIIAVPTRSLIEDKVNQEVYKNAGLIGVSSDREVSSIPCNCTKIICTYQSLPKLSRMIDISRWNLVVDEMHMLTRMISFSKNSLIWIMENFKNFASYRFISATVPSNECLLPALKDIDVVEIEWQDKIEVSFDCLLSENIRESILQIAMEHKSGIRKGNPYFFYNSIGGICNVIQALRKISNKSEFKFKPSVICSKSEKTTKTLRRFGATPKNSSQTSDINFITSTAFEGQDFYDEDGATYIVVDGDYRNTRYSLVTTIPQIVGRLRNSKYNNRVTVLFTGSTPVRFQSEEELHESIQRSIEMAKGTIEAYYENVDRIDRTRVADAILSVAAIDGYIAIDSEEDTSLEEISEGQLKVSGGGIKLDLFEEAKILDIEEYNLLRSNMYINSPDADNSNHIANKLTSCIGKAPVLAGDFRKLVKTREIGLRKLCDLYEEDKELCEKQDPEFFQYIETYGVAKIKALGYSRQVLLSVVQSQAKKSSDTFTRRLSKKIEIGGVYTNEQIKKILKSCGIEKCTAQTIKEYFNVVPCKLKGVRALKIVSEA